MAWTYDSDLPTTKDKVRFLCGDTDANDQLAQDSEITFALVDSGTNVYKAAALVCRAIAARLRNSLSLDATAGSFSLDAQRSADGFMELAKELDARVSMNEAGVFAGGISVAGKRSVESDTDRVAPGFSSRLHRRSTVSDERTNTCD